MNAVKLQTCTKHWNLENIYHPILKVLETTEMIKFLTVWRDVGNVEDSIFFPFCRNIFSNSNNVQYFPQDNVHCMAFLKSVILLGRTMLRILALQRMQHTETEHTKYYKKPITSRLPRETFRDVSNPAEKSYKGILKASSALNVKTR